MRFYLPLTSLLLSGPLGVAACHSTSPQQIASEETIWTIGETQVQIRVDEGPGSDLVFINLHDDENTGVKVGQSLLRQNGGRLVQLVHDGGRLISFDSSGQRFTFDPNRMFTDQGTRRSLSQEGSYSEKAFSDVRRFAKKVLSICRFEGLSLIVTLHNNGPDGYSAADYQKGGVYEADALDVHLEPNTDPDDFYFVTDITLFNFFRDRQFNVVLQDNENVCDDGSLSVLAGERGIPYVNVEAEKGHFQQQLKMLQEVYTAYGN